MSGPPEDRSGQTNAAADEDGSLRQGLRSLPIELEPISSEPIPQRNIGQFPDARTETQGSTHAIPPRPLHLCPSCDYNLTGLTARRCPECGDPFTLQDARMRGFETSEPMKEFARRLTWGKTVLIISWTLIITAIYCSNSIRITLSPFSVSVLTWTSLTSAGFLMIILTISMLMIAMLIRAYFEIPSSYVLLAVGVTLSIMALLIVL